jgi:hypothetical protein
VEIALARWWDAATGPGMSGSGSSRSTGKGGRSGNCFPSPASFKKSGHCDLRVPPVRHSGGNGGGGAEDPGICGGSPRSNWLFKCRHFQPSPWRAGRAGACHRGIFRGRSFALHEFLSPPGMEPEPGPAIPGQAVQETSGHRSHPAPRASDLYLQPCSVFQSVKISASEALPMPALFLYRIVNSSGPWAKNSWERGTLIWTTSRDSE